MEGARRAWAFPIGLPPDDAQLNYQYALASPPRLKRGLAEIWSSPLRQRDALMVAR